LSVQVKQIVARRSLRNNAQRGRLGDPSLAQLWVKLNAPLLATVKSSSTTTDRFFATAIIAQN